MGKAVLIQPSFYESMKVLPDNERLRLYDAICEYSLNGIEPENLPPIVNSFFLLMKPNIDASNKRYRASSSNGKTGGAPPGNQNARKQPKNNQTKQPKNNQTKQPKNNQTKLPKNKQDLELEGIYPSKGDISPNIQGVHNISSSARLDGRPPADEIYDRSWMPEGGGGA